MGYDIQTPRDVSAYGDPRKHGARCDICPLAGSVVVPHLPNERKLRLVIVGEGPGRKEEILKTPFVGATGELLDDALVDVGLRRDDAWITNASLCLEGPTQVRMADGTRMRLNQIVKMKHTGPVLSVGKHGDIVAQEIVGWHRSPRAQRKIVEVSYRHARVNHNGANRTLLTDDHKVLTSEGWKAAGDVHGMLVATGDKAPIGLSRDIAIGTLLGDGHIPSKRGAALGVTHANDQRQYAALKAKALGGAPLRKEAGRNGWQSKVRFSTYASGFFRELRKRFYVRGQKRIPKGIIANASDMLVAVWYMDDGCLRSHGAEICVAGYSRTDVLRAARELRSRGFSCGVTPKGQKHRIIFRAKDAAKLFERIARYIPPQMQYKLPEVNRGLFDSSAYEPAIGPYYDRAIVRPSRSRINAQLLYCIDVAKTHNFITTGVVVHNCAGDNDKDNERAAECCAPRLGRELAKLPKDAPIVTLGKAATKGVLGVNSVLLARGFVWTARDLEGSISNAEAALRKAQRGTKEKTVVEAKLRLETLKQRHKLAGRIVLPTLHPTFAFIHNETWAPIFRIDLERASRVIRGELTLDMLEDRIEEVKSLAELKRRKQTFIITDSAADIDKLSRILGPEVACDIETERAKPLSPLTVKVLCVQISDGDRSFVIGPWDKKLHAAALTRFFSGRVVVFHNGFNFDHPALEREGVLMNPFGDDATKARFVSENPWFDLAAWVPPKLEDTLVAHHAFASQYPQKLDHVVATFLDSSPWKIRFGVRGAEEKGLAPQHVEGNELYLYGASDAVVTIKAWRAMQNDLAPEMAVYEHDKLLGFQGKMLQVVGFRVDRKRRRALSKALKNRAAALKGRMRKLSGKPQFQPSKLNEVRKVLFGTLRAPMLNPTASGLASTSNATLEVIRTGGAGTARRGPADTKKTSGPIENKTRQTRAGLFAESLLRWRVTVKIKGTYVDPVPIHADGRAHYNWRPYGTVSGRYSSRFQSNPRWSMAVEDRPREQYIASPDCDLWYFDLSQAEARFAANLSGDENFIATCRGDVHTGNAKILFPQEAAQEKLNRDSKGKHCPQHGDKPQTGAACNCGKPYRDIAKNAGFAVAYLAEVATVFAYLRAHGFPVELDDVDTMLTALKNSYKRYYEYVAENVKFVEENGFLRTALMQRVRWFGFHPKPQEIANFPIQSGIADVMNTRLLVMQERMARETPGVRLVAQVHDAAIFDVPRRYTRWEVNAKGYKSARGPIAEMIEQTWAEPVRLKPSVVCRAEREFLLPAEIKVGRRWSDFG